MSAEMGAGIGAVAASAGPAIGASIGAGAEIGAASIPSFGAETFATQIPSIYSGIPSAIEPVGIETFSPSASLIAELDAPPAALSGEFTIQDIINPLPAIGIESTKLEPAISQALDTAEEVEVPKIILPAFEPLIKIDEEEKPLVELEPITIPSLFKQPIAESTPATEITSDALPQADRAIGAFATELMTLGTISQPQQAPEEQLQQEAQTNQLALQNAVAILESYDFTEEEAATWEAKLQAATQTETEGEEDVEVELQDTDELVIELTEGEEPPKGVNPTTEDEDENEKLKTTQDEIITLYQIGQKQESAQRINKRRAGIASQIASDVYKSEDPRTTAQAQMAALDVPEVEDLLDGELEYVPALSPKIEMALNFVNETDPKAVAKTVTEIVNGNQATKRVNYLESATEIEKEELSKEAQKLIEEGEKVILYKKNKQHWIPGQTTKPPLINPFEVEVKKAA